MRPSLDAPTRRALKKQAHHLKPVVQTGAAGLTDAVLAEMDRALTDHELVKIKLAADDKQSFGADVEQSCERLAAACIQTIGRTAVLYRPDPDNPKSTRK